MKKICVALALLATLCLAACGSPETCRAFMTCNKTGGQIQACCTATDCKYVAGDQEFACAGTNCSEAAKVVVAYCK